MALLPFAGPGLGCLSCMIMREAQGDAWCTVEDSYIKIMSFSCSSITVLTWYFLPPLKFPPCCHPGCQSTSTDRIIYSVLGLVQSGYYSTNPNSFSIKMVSYFGGPPSLLLWSSRVTSLASSPAITQVKQKGNLTDRVLFLRLI